MLMCSDFTKAVKGGISGLNGDLAVSVTQILEDIHSRFRDLVDERVEDKSEQRLGQEIAKFLETAASQFEDMRYELKRIKRKHGCAS